MGVPFLDDEENAYTQTFVSNVALFGILLENKPNQIHYQTAWNCI